MQIRRDYAASVLAVDDGRKPGKWLINVPMREPLAEIAGDDALNALIDLFDALLRAQAEPGSGHQAKAKCRKKTERERFFGTSEELRPLTPAGQ